MKINTCDLCGEEEKCVLGAKGDIEDYCYGLAVYQLHTKCKMKVDCIAGEFIRGTK